MFCASHREKPAPSVNFKTRALFSSTVPSAKNFTAGKLSNVTGVAARRYEMRAEDMRACFSVPPSASTIEHLNAVRSCIYGELVDGVWNLTHSTGAPVLLSRAHYYGADPRMLASLGPGGGPADGEEDVKQLNLILKADVSGSLEAVKAALGAIASDKV